MERKERNPNETIKHIKSILNKNDISTSNVKKSNIKNKFFSCRIELKSIKGIGTNGKGTTKQFAIASAYGEFMERLQTMMLLDNSFLLKATGCLHKNKITRQEFKECYNDYYNAFFHDHDSSYTENFWDFALDESNRYVEKFEDIVNNTTKNLPIKTINFFTHTNGLCAGNTYEEAVVQGICEVLERYVYRQILVHNMLLPDINIYDIDGMDKYISQLNRMNLDICIKDCSLGGIYPVIGVTIIDKINQKCLFAIGADTNINIAIQRCLTEMLQGCKQKEFYTKMKDIKEIYEYDKKITDNNFVSLNWLKNCSSNNGIYPSNILPSGIIKKIKDLPFVNLNKNSECLQYLINWAKENHRKIYVKDCGILQFPTYKVYIPFLSEIEEFEQEEFNFMLMKQKLQDIFLNFNNSCDSLTNNELDILFKISNMDKYKHFILPKDFLKLNCYIDTWFSKVDYNMLLIYYLIKHDKYDLLINYLNMYIAKNQLKKETIEYYNYIKVFADLKKSNALEKFIFNKKNRLQNDAYKLVKDIQKYFKDKKISSCPNCRECKLKKKCKFIEWEKIFSSICKCNIDRDV